MVKGLKMGRAGSVDNFGRQMSGDGSFVPVFASAGIGPQGRTDGAEQKVDPQWKQHDYAEAR